MPGILRSNLIRIASSLPVGGKTRRQLLAILEEDDDVDFTTDLRRGVIVVSGPGTVSQLAQQINRQFLPRWHYGPFHVPREKGAMRAFSFHWSNAQAAWNVIPIKQFPWTTDGAEFILFTMPSATSGIGKPWVLREMEYVAAKLRPHPGHASSYESGRAGRVADRWLLRS